MLDTQRQIHHADPMNRLPIAKRAQIVQMLVEGSSLRATTRMAGASINTVTKLLLDVADAAHAYHHSTVRDVRSKRIQCDEIWCFVGAKARNATPLQKADRRGDIWTWTAVDADSRLCLSYLVGGRDAWWANEFMQDVAERVRDHVQLTADGHRAYLEAVQSASDGDVDYAQLQKIYGASDEPEKRYSPAKSIDCAMKTVSGVPDPKHVSNNFVERRNLTIRMSMRRFTRLTDAFSKKVENHAAAVALHFLHYNFARIHGTLKVTPAMAAGISDHIWSYEEITSLAD